MLYLKNTQYTFVGNFDWKLKRRIKMFKKIVLILLLGLLVSVNVSAQQWTKAEPKGERIVSDIDYYQGNNNIALDRLLKDYNSIALVYNSIAQLTASVGEVTVSNTDGSVRLFLSNASTTTITWANIDAGTEAASTTYYVYAIAALATSEEATFLISTNSTTPTGATYYKRIGSFYNNSSSNIEQIKNDDDLVSISSGTIANGATISLPSGYLDDECDWIVSGNDIGPTAYEETDYRHYVSVSSRVVTARARNTYYGTYVNGTANFLGVCHR